MALKTVLNKIIVEPVEAEPHQVSSSLIPQKKNHKKES